MLASYSTDADSHATKSASDSGTTESIAMATRLCESSECPRGPGRAEERLGFFLAKALANGSILQLQRVGGII